MTIEPLSASTLMMKGQLATNGIHDPRIVDALLHTDRSAFLPEALHGAAYVDDDLPIAKGRYMLEPLIFARLLEYAKIQPEHNVLDVGAGYGYSSAVLSCLSPHIVAIEESPDMVAQARTIFASLNIRAIDIITAPLKAGCDAHKPYDRIIIEGALPKIPEALENQLAEGGILVGLRLTSRIFATQKALCDIVVGIKQNDSVRYVEKERICAYPLSESYQKEFFSFTL